MNAHQKQILRECCRVVIVTTLTVLTWLVVVSWVINHLTGCAPEPP